MSSIVLLFRLSAGSVTVVRFKGQPGFHRILTNERTRYCNLGVTGYVGRYIPTNHVSRDYGQIETLAHLYQYMPME